MIAQSSIDEVMNRADIVEVVEQFVRLKKRGANYIANCPFHNEKSPSFSVSASKGIFKCFGCGKGGNAVTFVQEHEKITYPEAIRWLAEFYKIAIDETKPSEEQQQQQQIEESLRLFNEFAANYFTSTLMDTEEGQAIGLSYFKERGFRADMLSLFRLGYCPEDGSSFFKAATEKGYSTELMEKSGLVKNNNGRWYDTYRGRVIFPIQNMTGRVLGFGARILKTNDKAPKYINSPENELYNKSRVLYGLYQSRQVIGKVDECYLVEGYTDVISLHQGGVGNVVSSSGTSLTEDQLRIIGRTTKNLTILYDGDGAGIKAAMRGMDMALSQSFNVKLALLPDGQDPDSYIQAVGESGFNEYVKAHKRDIIGFRMEVGMKEVANDPVKKSKLVNEIAESISRINKAEDFALQDYYIKEAAELLKVDENGLVNLVNKFIRDRIDQDKRQGQYAHTEGNEIDSAAAISTEEAIDSASQQTQDESQEWQLIRVLLTHGDKASEGYANAAQLIYDRIDPEMIESQEALLFFNTYFAFISEHQQLPTLQYFTQHPNQKIQIRSAGLLQEKNEVSHNWLEVYGIGSLNGDDNYLNDIESTLGYFELKKVKIMQAEIREALHKTKDDQEAITLMQQFMGLKKTENEILQRPGTVIVQSAGR
ncbi:MAG: DNA primase [Chitinophagaceae bacterium]|nr:DNA primase [Chitinophagaceae bacterium]